MVWQPNILNNCYELLGGSAPRTTHHGLCWGTSVPQTPCAPHLQILATPLYMTGENGIGVMTHELAFNKLDVESQYLLKLQNGKFTNIPHPVTAKCPRQMSCWQSLEVFSRAHGVTNAFGGRAPPAPAVLVSWRRGVVVSGVRRMNEVDARRARLVPG